MHGSATSAANPSGVRGICPAGWHVPSDAEWTQLTDYVSSQSVYLCNGNSGEIAKAMAATTGWNSYSSSCTVGNTPGDNNATGFSAFPAGYYNGSYDLFGVGAYFWSATLASSNIAWDRILRYYDTSVYKSNYSTHMGLSVRCVRD